MNPLDLLSMNLTSGIPPQKLLTAPINWLILAPQMILILTALTMMLLDATFWRKYRHWVGFAGGVGMFIAAIVGLNVPLGTTYGGMVVFDGMARVALLLFCSLGIITFLLSRDYLNAQKLNYGEYYILLIFAVIGMIIMASTRELLTFFIGLETLSIPLYVLAGWGIYSRRSNEAGVKYLMLGAFGGAFLVFGISLMYGATGALTYDKIFAALSELKDGRALLFQFGFALFLIGLAFKISIVPFHMWTPDVYEGSPAPITAFMSVGTKAAAMLGLMRFLSEAIGTNVTPQLTNILAVLAVITMLVGNTGAVMQNNLKRMLAYSAIAHAGYLMVGLLTLSKTSQAAILYYMFAYMFMNLGAFGVIIAIAGKDDEGTRIDDFNGLAYRKPVLAALMTLCMLSMAGIPPTVGFFSKFYLFGGAIVAGWYKVVIFALMTSVVGVFYYLKVVVAMYMKPAGPDAENQPYTMSPVLTIGLILCGVGTLAAGMFPDKLLQPLLQMVAAVR